MVKSGQVTQLYPLNEGTLAEACQACDLNVRKAPHEKAEKIRLQQQGYPLSRELREKFTISACTRQTIKQGSRTSIKIRRVPKFVHWSNVIGTAYMLLLAYLVYFSVFMHCGTK